MQLSFDNEHVSLLQTVLSCPNTAGGLALAGPWLSDPSSNSDVRNPGFIDIQFKW